MRYCIGCEDDIKTRNKKPKCGKSIIIIREKTITVVTYF
jgi:hypothetical protein